MYLALIFLGYSCVLRKQCDCLDDIYYSFSISLPENGKCTCLFFDISEAVNKVNCNCLYTKVMKRHVSSSFAL